jgi:histidinol-phosphatase
VTTTKQTASLASDDLALALRAAEVADAISLSGFESRSFRVDHKSDASEVTEIDRNTESAISELLRRERPDYSLYGEEHGVVGPADATYQWVIDPIDGTSNFVRGVPVWATLIALVEEGTPMLGVVSAPALGRRWWAVRGGGAFCGKIGAIVDPLRDALRLRVSDVDSLADASASITVTDSWHRASKTTQLDSLQRGVKRLRNYGDFWQHMLVAQGAVDFAIDAIGLGPYDNAAIYPIVTEAGGTVTDRLGAADYQSNSLITSNGHLHSIVVGALNGAT